MGTDTVPPSTNVLPAAKWGLGMGEKKLVDFKKGRQGSSQPKRRTMVLRSRLRLASWLPGWMVRKLGS